MFVFESLVFIGYVNHVFGFYTGSEIAWCLLSSIRIIYCSDYLRHFSNLCAPANFFHACSGPRYSYKLVPVQDVPNPNPDPKFWTGMSVEKISITGIWSGISHPISSGYDPVFSLSLLTCGTYPYEQSILDVGICPRTFSCKRPYFTIFSSVFLRYSTKDFWPLGSNVTGRLSSFSVFSLFVECSLSDTWC